MGKDRVGLLFEKTIYSLIWFFSHVIYFCLFFMSFYVTSDIIFRSLSGSAIGGTIEINEYLLVITGFLGIVNAEKHNGHIAVDIFYRLISPTKQYFLDQINNIILLAFSIFFIYAGVQKAILAYEIGESNWFGDNILSVWFIRWVVPITFTMLSFQILIRLFRLKKRRLSASKQ